MAGSSGRWGLAGIAVGVIAGALIPTALYLYFAQPRDDAALQSGSVQVLGSESMRPAVTACAEDFMTRNPDADVIVRGGGSGDGVAALLHGLVDIGMTSRELSPREREYAGGRGFEVSVFPMALDGVTIVVNRANPVTTLSIDRLREIFTGKIRNWRELEGHDGDIMPFARAAGSGTASLFGERALGEKEYGPSVERLPTNEAIVAEVAARPGAIGYAGLGALRVGGDRVRAVALTAGAQPSPVGATPETIIAGTYPLSRKLYLATAGPPLGTAKAFIDFCLSANGQALFQRAGYVSMKSAAR
jgi:phosphate transport system substrate-binding protein